MDLRLSMRLGRKRASGGDPPPPSTAGQPIGFLLLLTKAS